MVRWQKPAPTKFKCNVNASFSSSHNKFGIYTCIQDADRCFVLAKTTWFAPLYSMDVSEASGLCHAL